MGRRLPKPGQSFAEKRPDLVDEWHPDNTLSPHEVSAGSHEKVRWRCKGCNHEWDNQVQHRYRRNQGCPFCNRNALHIDRRNSLASIRPDLLLEWHPTKNEDLDPNEITAFNIRIIWWQCKDCNHEWDVALNARTRMNSNCPYCAGKAVHTDGRNSMRSTHPLLARELHPTKNGEINPDNIIAGTAKLLWWKCSRDCEYIKGAICENVWLNSGDHRAAGQGCGACKNLRLHSDGRNSLAAIRPDLIEQWHPTKNGDLTPYQITSKSSKRVWWKCNQGPDHEWSTLLSSRVGNNLGCPYCSNQKVSLTNCLATTYPELSKEWDYELNGDLTPHDVVPGNSNKAWWVCSIHGSFEQAISARTGKRKQKCPDCALSGFRPSSPATYYVHQIINNETDDRLFFKGGISGDWEFRLSQLRTGLPENMRIENIESLEFQYGRDARKLETQLKKIYNIRAPNREFEGGHELFIVNPLEYARENGLI